MKQLKVSEVLLSLSLSLFMTQESLIGQAFGPLAWHRILTRKNYSLGVHGCSKFCMSSTDGLFFWEICLFSARKKRENSLVPYLNIKRALDYPSNHGNQPYMRKYMKLVQNIQNPVEILMDKYY